MIKTTLPRKNENAIELSLVGNTTDLWLGYWRINDRQFRLLVDEKSRSMVLQEMKGAKDWADFMVGTLHDPDKPEAKNAVTYYGYLLRGDQERSISLWINERQTAGSVRLPEDLRKATKFDTKTRLMRAVIG